MRLYLALVAATAFLSVPVCAEELPSIFNGENLDGWVEPRGNIWWTVEDGILNVQSGPERKGSTLWTRDSYKNFIMEFDFKFGEGTVDSGIYVRTSGEQIQIGESGSLKRDMTGSPYISGKGYPVEAEGVADLLRPERWNEMTIVVKANHYSVWLNGMPVMQYQSESAAEEGPVGIQLHGNRDMSIQYRDIRLAELD